MDLAFNFAAGRRRIGSLSLFTGMRTLKGEKRRAMPPRLLSTEISPFEWRLLCNICCCCSKRWGNPIELKAIWLLYSRRKEEASFITPKFRGIEFYAREI